MITPEACPPVRHGFWPLAGFMAIGFMLLACAWDVLYKAQRSRTLATTGPYARVRHPQYLGFVVIMVGFLLQWPTLVTLIMFPVLVAMYVHLAHREERDSIDAFGDVYRQYMKDVPAFVPRPDAGSPRPRSLMGRGSGQCRAVSTSCVLRFPAETNEPALGARTC